MLSNKNSTKYGFYKPSVKNILSKIVDGCIILKDSDIQQYGETNSKLRANINVNNPMFYRSVFIGGGIGFAESYIREEWETDNLTNLIRIFARNIDLVDRLDNKSKFVFIHFIAQISYMLDKNNLSGSKKNISKHYDLGNDFFSSFLDKEMMYSCADFSSTDDLEEASLNKLDNICKYLELKESDHLLEIGCGWGGMAIYAALKYGCKVTTTTISKEQYDFTKEKINSNNLQDKITLLFKDYRELEGKFDKLVSIEMIEAVGHQYFSAYFKKCNDLVTEDGLCLIQAITMNEQKFKKARKEVDFIKKHIFPGGCLPSIASIMHNVAQDTTYRLYKLNDITLDYAKTLNCWQQRFLENKDKLLALGFNEEFIRKWQYYFSYCEAGFLEFNVYTYQLLFAKNKYRPIS